MWPVSPIGLKCQSIFLPENIDRGKSLMVFKRHLRFKKLKMHLLSKKLKDVSSIFMTLSIQSSIK